MFSKILVKLIDQAIIPALVLLVTRILSVVVVARYFNVSVTFGASGFVFSHPNDYILVNSYSTLSMIVVLTVGLFYILIKSLAFHDTHIHPKLTASLFSLRLSSVIQSSFDIYSQAIVWLSYTFLLTLVSGILSVFGFLYNWVFYVSLVLSVIAAALFIFDVENEITMHQSQKTEDMDTDEELILNFEDEGGEEENEQVL
jgi:hypothetical protein